LAIEIISKFFASAEGCEDWLKQHNPEGVAFEYDVEGELVTGWVAR
jgi:hypothetical protein